MEPRSRAVAMPRRIFSAVLGPNLESFASRPSRAAASSSSIVSIPSSRRRRATIQHLEKPFGHRLAQLLEVARFPGFDQIANDGERSRAESPHCGELARLVERLQIIGADGKQTLGGAKVGFRLEPVLAVQFEVRRDASKDVRGGS